MPIASHRSGHLIRNATKYSIVFAARSRELTIVNTARYDRFAAADTPNNLLEAQIGLLNLEVPKRARLG